MVSAAHLKQEASFHILVVDDDERLRSLLSRFLKEHGFIVSVAEDAASARMHLHSFCFDAIVLDIMMPNETGLEFTAWLRNQSNEISRTPVLLLSAKGEIDDRIEGLELGADDFLPKPFEPRELVARLKTILRRTPQDDPVLEEKTVYEFGVFTFNTASLSLNEEGRAVKLAPIEQHLLLQLLQAQGEAVEREALAKSAPIVSTPRSIDVQIGRLRRKIESDPKIPKFIHTVRGVGYRLLVGRN